MTETEIYEALNALRDLGRACLALEKAKGDEIGPAMDEVRRQKNLMAVFCRDFVVAEGVNPGKVK